MIAEPRQLRASSFQIAGVKNVFVSKQSNKSVYLERQEFAVLTYERIKMAYLFDNKGSQNVGYHVNLSMKKLEWLLDVARGYESMETDTAFCVLFRSVKTAECFNLNVGHQLCREEQNGYRDSGQGLNGVRLSDCIYRE
ncbi:hypothetical protein KXD40_007765 [Peronospora effusa]|uniref:Uncharacterized protein n=1 Tax=Peronospora effusa TaxID=542832 RepID=A0A3R7YSD7_9STRA|nr:hypothetical protein DD237_000808 [Peronospora effusa]UIZ23372.1 hypothetical protein KXD40_007765 [Peronospora effusa]